MTNCYLDSIIKGMPEKDSKQNPAENSSYPQESTSTTNNKLVLVIGLVVVVLLLLAGVGYYANKFLAEEAAETAIETATGGQAEVDADGNKVSVEANDQKLTIGQNEVPESFPADLSIYNGSTVAATTESDDGISVQLTTNDSVTSVYDFYKKNLADNGWTETSDSTAGQSRSLSAEKAGKTVLITISQNTEENNTSIIIIHTDAS